ncbi:MAG: flagellar M-ring protein FliF [Pseudonocardiales bacterium]|jgi:flagellar M-ring protein FliF|nr:flagellar M-ring protein FliF [Pseudonocardiales bacterium]
MKDQILERLLGFWRGFLAFSPGQKAVTIAAVVALAVGGWMFSSWASKPTYAPLFTNLAPADASAIIDKLNASKSPYQLAANGTEILVPQKQVYPLRLTMSSAGLPTAGSTGYSLLDKEGITTSEFKQHVDYQRALEGELSNTIKSISGVAAAAVHLAIPQPTVFDDGTQKPTASVLLTTLPGTILTTPQVQSVVNLVSSSVPGLSADQVSVSDSTGKVLSTAGDGISSALSDTRAQQTQAYEQQIDSNVQAMLDKMVGPGHAQVVAHADLNYDKVTSSATVYSSASGVPPLAEANSSESLGGGASSAGGVVGAGTPAASSSGSPANSGYLKTSNTRNNAVNSDVSTTTPALGNVRSLSLAVLLDQKTAGTVNLNSVKQLVSSAAGLDLKRGDSLAVTTAPFNTSQADAAAAAAAAAARQAASAKRSAQLVSLLKTGGLVLLVVAVVVITLIANKRRKNTEPPDDLDLFLSTLRDDPDSLPPAPRDVVPQPSGESQLGQARQRQLAEMADSDPQEVARLLRGWLNSKEN